MIIFLHQNVFHPTRRRRSCDIAIRFDEAAEVVRMKNVARDSINVHVNKIITLPYYHRSARISCVCVWVEEVEKWKIIIISSEICISSLSCAIHNISSAKLLVLLLLLLCFCSLSAMIRQIVGLCYITTGFLFSTPTLTLCHRLSHVDYNGIVVILSCHRGVFKAHLFSNSPLGVLCTT